MGNASIVRNVNRNRVSFTTGPSNRWFPCARNDPIQLKTPSSVSENIREYEKKMVGEGLRGQ